MNLHPLRKYSIWNMAVALQEYREKVKERRENFGGTSGPAFSILGMSLAVFAIIFVLSLAIWLWALFLLIKRSKTMPTWAVITSIVGMLFFAGGPIVTIVLCYATSEQKRYLSQEEVDKMLAKGALPRSPVYTPIGR
jgi:chromate transport protein ChrA